MALETGTYIDDLVVTNPLGTDNKSQGDDHLRLIKSLLKATFPGMTGEAFRVQDKAAGYTPVAGDNTSLINCTAALTLSLTAAATLGNKWLLIILGNGGDVTIDPNGTENINGASDSATLPNGALGLLVCDGTEFYLGMMPTTLTAAALTVLDDATVGAMLTTLGGLANIVEDVTPQLGAALATNSFAINESEGAAVVAATTTDIFGGDDGNTLHITGNTQIDDFTDASSIGQWRKCIFDGTPQVTSGSGITVFGGTRTAVAGDMLFVYADAVDAFDAFWVKADGTAVAASGLVLQIVEMTVAKANNTTTIPWDDTAPGVGEGTQLASQAITPGDNSNKVLITGGIQASVDNANDGLTVALFRGSTCIASVALHNIAALDTKMYSFSVLDSPASASAVTYSVRIGAETSGGWDVYTLPTADDQGGTTSNNSFFLTEISA